MYDKEVKAIERDKEIDPCEQERQEFPRNFILTIDLKVF